MCHMKKTSSSKSEVKTTASPVKPVGKEILEEEERRESRFDASENINERTENLNNKSEDTGLPEHLRNFKEFHSLPPPSSNKFMVLNRRIKRSPRYFVFIHI